MVSKLCYLAFDDTDTLESPMGTGRCMRTFCQGLPGTYHVVGVLRHQLPRLEAIPFTSNNSSACAIIEIGQEGSLDQLVELATGHLLAHFVEGSDPGLCAAMGHEVEEELVNFGIQATGRLMSRKDAVRAAGGNVLQGLGGTNDGIIGAAAGVGLTIHGWCGRFIEYGSLRELRDPLTVADLQAAGIRVVSVDRDPLVPQPGDPVASGGWIRPSLWAGGPVLQVRQEDGVWHTAHRKRKKRKDAARTQA